MAQRKFELADTPLKVFGLLVGTSELAMTIAATKTTGYVQGAFTTFSIVFFLLLLAGFFAILWTRAHVLYSPREFGNQDPRAFAAAMNQRAVSAPADALVTLDRGLES